MLLFAATPDPGLTADLEMRHHMVRLDVLGGASVAGGAALTFAGWQDERLRWAGIATVGSGAIDLAIGAPPLFAPVRSRTPEEVARTREIIALNVGLDAAYLGSGLAMGLLSEDERVQGVGWALAAQGIGLGVLDAIVWARLPKPQF